MNGTQQQRPQSDLELPDAFETFGTTLVDRAGTEYVYRERASNGGKP